MDYKKISFFIIKERKSKINYELKLSKDIRIYPVFYILLLKSVDSEIPIFIKKISEITQDDEYKVKKIVEYNSWI